MLHDDDRPASLSGLHTEFDLFISYRRDDNAHGLVSTLHQEILADQRRYSTWVPRIFFDTEAIRGLDDWRHRIQSALRNTKILLVCISPGYFESSYCRWE